MQLKLISSECDIHNLFFTQMNIRIYMWLTIIRKKLKQINILIYCDFLNICQTLKWTLSHGKICPWSTFGDTRCHNPQMSSSSLSSKPCSSPLFQEGIPPTWKDKEYPCLPVKEARSNLNLPRRSLEGRLFRQIKGSPGVFGPSEAKLQDPLRVQPWISPKTPCN